ncbi:type III effector [Pseudomonas viridiflava]|uniref:HopPtoA1-like protein n=1 Tax=Pseudomonas viridiflava TaxID=33069 RepID=I6LCT9_PSEVI|nr:HopPtoA1-like protein [Pseudomonas viridiflava]AAT96223.1 HopPtoA1-like protein [Pseudomonas viridiflava]TKJ68324.1 type III effector [Pseudomonas viridiflava]TKK31099.1 type III effector [Pseudomonas viridiflava]
MQSVNHSMRAQSLEITRMQSSRASNDASSVEAASVTDQANHLDIVEHLNSYFEVHKMPVSGSVSAADGDELRANQAHNDKINALVSSRARVLVDMGETKAMIADTFAKAEMLDRLATTASSALRAVPFAGASVLQYMQPAINKGDWLPTSLKPLTPLISGAVSGAMDQIGTAMMNRATADIHYLKAAPEDLHDVLAASVKRHAPGLARQSLDLGIAVQTYTARNALRTVLAPALASRPEIQGAVDISVSAAGGLVANAGLGNRMLSVQARDHQRGAALVLGLKDKQPKATLDEETDWLEAYNAIKSASYSGAAINAGKRMAGLPLDAMTDGVKAVAGYMTGTSLMKNGLVLAGGFAAVGKVQEAGTRTISNPVTKALVSQVTNLAGSAPVFAAWTTVDVVGDTLTDKTEAFIQNTVKSSASSAADYAAARTAKLATDGLRASGEAMTYTGERLRQTFDTLRHRTVREPDIEEGGRSAG